MLKYPERGNEARLEMSNYKKPSDDNLFSLFTCTVRFFVSFTIPNHFLTYQHQNVIIRLPFTAQERVCLVSIEIDNFIPHFTGRS